MDLFGPPIVPLKLALLILAFALAAFGIARSSSKSEAAYILRPVAWCLMVVVVLLMLDAGLLK